MKTIPALLSLLILFLNSSHSLAQYRSEKRGIAFGYHSEADLETASKGMAWWYNWAVTPDNNVKEIYETYNMDFVPMVWNGSSDTSKLRTFLKTHPGVKYILGFNEPNFKTQANMTPAKAAANWPKIEALADEFGLKIVGPAVNYCDQCVDIPGTTNDSNPFAYLDAFFEACPDCRVDYIAAHNYMCYTSALQGYLEGFHKYGKKIWLTEFACWDQATITLDMQKSLVIGAIDYLENDSNIFRYSWFTGDRTGKWPYLDIYGPKAGTLTELGELYLNFYPVHDTEVYYPIPARIEAESYNAMSGIQLEATSDFDGMANIGWFDGGDWLQYNVDVPESGEYYLYARIASNASTNVSVIENDSTRAYLAIPNSGGWQNWRTYQLPVTLSKGLHELKLTSSVGSLNVNWVYFKQNQNHIPEVFADEDTVIYQPENSIFLTSTGTDEDGDSLIYRWTKTSGKNDITIQSPCESSTEITGFTNGKYTFKVTVSDGIETSTDEVKTTVQNKVGITGMEQGVPLIFPNPTDGLLHVQVPNLSSDALLGIYSLDGTLRFTCKLIKFTSGIDVSAFHNGFYIVKIMNDGTIWEDSFLKK